MEYDPRILLDSYSVQEIVEVFLALVIGIVSIFYIAGAAAGYDQLVVPLSLVFYSVIPISLVLIGFLTYKVSKMLYHSETRGKTLDKVVMSLLLALVSINIGFIISVSAGQQMLSGVLGMFKISFLLVMLSLALSISVLSRHLEGVDLN